MGVQPSGPKMMAAHSAVGWLIGRSSSTRFGRRVRSLVIVEVVTVSARRSIPNGRRYPHLWATGSCDETSTDNQFSS